MAAKVSKKSVKGETRAKKENNRREAKKRKRRGRGREPKQAGRREQKENKRKTKGNRGERSKRPLKANKACQNIFLLDK